jgi:hypothetical protein
MYEERLINAEIPIYLIMNSVWKCSVQPRVLLQLGEFSINAI